MIRAGEYTTTGKVSAVKKVHRNAVIAACRSGRLKAVLVDGRYLIPAREAEDYEPRRRKVRTVS